MSPEKQDRKDLILGLIAWFQSQGVQPDKAADVCLDVIVSVIGMAPPELQAEGIAALIADMGTCILVALKTSDYDEN